MTLFPVRDHWTWFLVTAIVIEVVRPVVVVRGSTVVPGPVSQASPIPSPSESAWEGFTTLGQLSVVFGTPSPSESAPLPEETTMVRVEVSTPPHGSRTVTVRMYDVATGDAKTRAPVFELIVAYAEPATDQVSGSLCASVAS